MEILSKVATKIEEISQSIDIMKSTLSAVYLVMDTGNVSAKDYSDAVYGVYRLCQGVQGQTEGLYRDLEAAENQERRRNNG